MYDLQCRSFIKSVIQGFLPGIALKLFLIFLPAILMIMSKFEGFNSLSSLERRSTSRYYLFNFINVFLGSIIAGSAFEQLNSFTNQQTSMLFSNVCHSLNCSVSLFLGNANRFVCGCMCMLVLCILYMHA